MSFYRLILIFTFFLISCSKENKQIEKETKLIEQKVKQRNFKKLNTIKTYEKNLVGQFHSAYHYTNSNYALFDFTDQEILVTNDNLESIKKWGKKGRGPSEFLKAKILAVTNNEIVPILDWKNRKFMIFDSEEKLKYEIPYKFRLLGANFFNDSTVFAIGGSSHNEMNFLKIPLNESIKELTFDKSFIVNEIPFPKDIHPILANAKFDASFQYLVVNFSLFGKILLIKKESNEHYFFETIDANQATAEVITVDNITRADRKTRKSISPRSFIRGKELFVMSYDRSKKEKEVLIDIYNLENGEYKYSIKPRDFTKGKVNKLLLVDGNSILVSEDELIKKYIFESL